MLLNKMREQTTEEGAQNIVEGAPLPTMPLPQLLEQGVEVNRETISPQPTLLPPLLKEQNIAPKPATLDEQHSNREIEKDVRKLTPSVTRNANVEKASSCEVKKGRCKKHNLEARKKVITSKKWGKKKEGFGWIYRRSTEYTCRMENLAPEVHEISDDVVLKNSDSHHKPEVVGIQPGD